MVEVEAREIVPGDIIEMDEGDVIPADSRLVEDDAIVQIDQSTITGESMAVTKRGRDKDILYSSSTLKRGTALAVVIATGPNTFVGRAAMLAVNATPNVGFVDTLHSIGRFLMLCDFLAILGTTLLCPSFHKRNKDPELICSYATAAAVEVCSGLHKWLLP